MATVYSQDQAAWAAEQGALLRKRRLSAIDRENVAAEIERVGGDDVAVLRERTRILLTALLRWAHQADLRTTGIASTITAQRVGIEHILDDSASLRPAMDDMVLEAYPEAKRLAVMESGLFDESFPEGLPFLPSEVFDLDYFPDPHAEDREDAWWRRGRRRQQKNA